MTVSTYKRNLKIFDLSDEEALRLVKAIKMSSDQNGILVMKSLRNSIKNALKEKPKFKKPIYQWINPKQ